MSKYSYAVVAASILAVGLVEDVPAHDAPTGWSYPFACCSNYDCREVADRSVSERQDGYHLSSGEVVPYDDQRVRISPDGKLHWCTVAGADDGRTLCLFVPPRSY